jgi:hypothetical protein
LRRQTEHLVLPRPFSWQVGEPSGAYVGAKLSFGVHVHMLRHACGYALANAGHDTRLIQDWLGQARKKGNVARRIAAPVGYWLVLGLITFVGINAAIKVEATRTRLFLIVIVIAIAFLGIPRRLRSCGRLCRPNLKRRKAGRTAGTATNEVATGAEFDSGKGAKLQRSVADS